jgi:two-component system, sensor histidine kinase
MNTARTQPQDKECNMAPRILIAEHCSSVSALLRDALSDDGYDVRTVENGKAALAQIAQTLPDVVLLDANLPDIDGIDILLKVKSDERTCDVSFIMVAEDGRDDKVVAALELGATDFVPKPFSKAVILARVRNVIRVRSAQERMRRARETAEAASAAKAGFLANMSHDIRVPMTAILGFADLLHTEGDIQRAPKERIRAIEAIQRNGKYLLDLVNDILDLSKVEAGKLDVAPVRCSAYQIVADVVSLMRVRAAQKGVPLEVEFPGSIPQTIHTDPTRLRQILVNLISNAVKFTHHGRVWVVVRLDQKDRDPRLIVEVHDTGIGMNEEQLADVFQPYSQATPYVDREYGGTGLGLAISKRLAEMLGGSITVTSHPGKGSVFSLSIAAGALEGVSLLENLSEAELESERAAQEDTARRIKLNGWLLLAEDGPDNQRLISYVLRKAGAEVIVADNGQMAVDLALSAQAKERPFDVILMDMQMPVLDGYAATRTLRTAGYTKPIIALTANAMAGDQEKCLNAGCDDYATKPIDRAKLLGTIARFVPQTHSPPNTELATHPTADLQPTYGPSRMAYK